MVSVGQELNNMFSRYFVFLDKGRLFHYNGNDYMKQSTRTAKMLSNGRVFYFKVNDVIHPIAY